MTKSRLIFSCHHFTSRKHNITPNVLQIKEKLGGQRWVTQKGTVAPSEKSKTMFLKALLAACYLTALQSCAACRDLPRATPSQRFQLLNLERRRWQAAHAWLRAPGPGSTRPRLQQGSRINQQPKQSCSTNSRLNESDGFVSGLIDFLIELYSNGNVNSSLIRHQRSRRAETL